MYEHTKNVNSYYFGEIGVACDNGEDILRCRERGFGLLEKDPDFLENKLFAGSYGEQWTLKKFCGGLFGMTGSTQKRCTEWQ